MKNTFGNNLTLTIFGESHGPAIGAVLDGLPAGIPIDETKIETDMDRRKAKGRLATARHEEDQVHILSGIWQGHTTGTSICLLIQNKNQHSKDYSDLKYRLRPGHADWTAWLKYHGYQDYRGGGHFSGRLTTALTAAGNIARQVLEHNGITILSHLETAWTYKDRNIDLNHIETEQELLQQPGLAILDQQVKEQCTQALEQLASQGNSAGAVIETIILGIQPGIGQPFFDSVESILAHLLFSVPAVKGVSFGDGFNLATMTGKEANDPLQNNNGTITTTTNHNGGINGGITNGMPITIHTAIKPTPSIYQTQQSVDWKTKENIQLQIKGRHDPFIAQRAIVVLENAIALGLLDLYMTKEGEEAIWK